MIFCWYREILCYLNTQFPTSYKYTIFVYYICVKNISHENMMFVFCV